MNLSKIFPKERLLDNPIFRLAYSHDASMYRLVPKAVVRPRDEKEVKSLLEYCRDMHTPVTFRAGGTSLSGQSITEGIIAEIIQNWEQHKEMNSGKQIELQPGVIGARANIYLKPYQRIIGPDPASINVARIGGIVSNNSSGMVCGVDNNTYHTLDSIRFILSSGHTYDTSVQSHYQIFNEKESVLSEALLQCKREIESNHNLVNKIRAKYRIKNTLGYSLNSFLDYEHPLDIFAHLLVGAEGTLAFISQVTLNTVPDPPLKTTGLVLFDSVDKTIQALPMLIDAGADAVELLDDASLRTVQYLKTPPFDPKIIQTDMAGLLFEFQEYNQHSIDKLVKNIPIELQKVGCVLSFGPTEDEATRIQLWNLRKGLYPTVGAMREKGTSVITEDLCYHYNDLPEVIKELRIICQKWRYDDSVIFGHAKEGNLHFAASMDFNSSDGVKRFDGLLKDMAELTVDKFNGSLKAEHGTGRNMAPFVEYEWGGELYQIMWKIKQNADPEGILNPDVLLTKDQKLHIKNLKPIPIVDDSVDLCVECGFCEPVCPSAGLSLTPRQRIVIARELRLNKKDTRINQKKLLEDIDYNSNKTCAADGLCEIMCPVNINTGNFVKTLRKDSHSKAGDWCVAWIQSHFKFTQSVLRGLITITHWWSKFIGDSIPHMLSKVLNKATNRSTPIWNENLSTPPISLRASEFKNNIDFIYYPSCVGRVISANNARESLSKVLIDLCEFSNIQLFIPEKIQRTCCGMPFSSKGYTQAGKTMTEQTVDLIFKVSEQGKIPILVDTTQCSFHLIEAGADLDKIYQEKWKQLVFVDVLPFLTELVKGKDQPQLDRDIILHPTCSTQKMENVDLMISIAEKCATKIIIPENYGCCGFAGDRGLLLPELTKNATKDEVKSLKNISTKVNGYSSSRTCEIGMMTATKHNYESIVFLVRDYLHSNV
jgi:D-lactate dehydrogenase